MDNDNTYRIWTIQLAQWRLAKERNIPLIDITAKTGLQAFAPDMRAVMAFKRNEMNKNTYNDLYLQKMAESQIKSARYWESLIKRHEFAVACYCPAFAFCHRYIFLTLIEKYLLDRGNTVILEGELTRLYF